MSRERTIRLIWERWLYISEYGFQWQINANTHSYSLNFRFVSNFECPVCAQVSAAGSGSLLGSASSLPLGFGMLGGLVPVSLPFQFPSLLNLPLGAAGSSAATSGSATSSNASFSTLTQSEWCTQARDVSTLCLLDSIWAPHTSSTDAEYNETWKDGVLIKMYTLDESYV